MRAVCFFHRAIEYFNGIIPILNNISKLWALNTLTIEWPNWLTKNTIHSRQKKNNQRCRYKNDNGDFFVYLKNR